MNIKEFFYVYKDRIKNTVLMITTMLSIIFLVTTCVLACVPNNEANTSSPNADTSAPLPIENEYIGYTSDGKLIKANSTIGFQNFAFSCSETSANKSVTLKATVLPEDASNKTLEWRAVWKKSDSAFANGKNPTDYVSVKASSDSMSCTVTYEQDFAEQVLIVANSVSTPDMRGTCTVDCAQKINNIAFETQEIPYSTKVKAYFFAGLKEINTNILGADIAQAIMPTNGALRVNCLDFPVTRTYFRFDTSKHYTVEDSYLANICNSNADANHIDYSVTFSFTPEFKKAMESSGITFAKSSWTENVNYSKNSGWPVNHNGILGTTDNEFYANFMETKLHSCFPSSISQNTIRQAISKNSGINHLNIIVTTKCAYGNNTWNVGSVKINPLAFNVPVKSVSLSNSNVKL